MMDQGEIIRRDCFVRDHFMAVIATSSRFWDIFQSLTLTEAEREFEEQKRLFHQIPPLLLEQYRGLYVISHDGRILDAHSDLDTLTNRFFAEHGDMPVYVSKVGGEMREVIDTPF